jgi:hypothetical protein
VLGVSNNGEDLGTVTFDVPLATAQNFYYNLPSIGSVDLITNLQFDQINNIAVSVFIETYGGIDGITDLQGRLVLSYSGELVSSFDLSHLQPGMYIVKSNAASSKLMISK